MMRPIINNTGGQVASVSTMRLTDLYQHLKQMSSSDICLLVGGPGAGKTSALKEMQSLVKDIDLVYAATTNAAAQALGGRTVHSLLSLPFGMKLEDRELIIQKISSSFLTYFMNNCRSKVLGLVIDEAFILDAYTLELIHEGLRVTNNKLATQELGVIKLVLCGDPAQLLAIGGLRFYEASIFIEDIPIFKLEGVFRQSGDLPLSSMWVEAINLYRTQGICSGIIQWIKELYAAGKRILTSSLDFNPSLDNFTIAFTNQMVDGINLQILINHCQLKGVNLHEMFKAEGKALYLAEGAPIVITNNDRDLGVFKRQRGTVLSIEKHDSNSQRIITRIGNKEINFLHQLGTDDLNLALGWAGTIHMSQGGTFNHIQVLMSDHVSSTPGAALVSLTRHVKSLRLVGMPLGAIDSLLTRGIDHKALQYV